MFDAFIIIIRSNRKQIDQNPYLDTGHEHNSWKAIWTYHQTVICLLGAKILA